MHADPRPPAAPSRVVVVVAAVLVSAALAVAGCSGGGAPVETRAGGVTLRAHLDPDPSRQENNALVIDVERGGAPLAGAHVALTAVMPAMGSMSEMRSPATVVEEKPGVYRASFDLPMKGAWTLDVDVAGARARYRITTGIKGLTADGAASTSGTTTAQPAASDSGAVVIEAVRRQKLGVRTTPAKTGPLSATLHAVGRVTYDETKLHDVTLKIGGYVDKLLVDKPGQKVKAGQTLLLLYSPELYAAQVELLAAERIDKTAAGAMQASLAQAARRRMDLWDLSPAQIDDVIASGKPKRRWPITAPSSGVVVVKDVVEGSKIDAGKTVFRIAGLDTVWVEADVYEQDLPQVHVGDPAVVTLSYGARTLPGKVSFIYPYLDDKTRTGRIRIELPNKDHSLLPDMFADVAIEERGPDVLQIPREAVIYTGKRRIVFVDRGGGNLAPVEVRLGRETADAVAVTAGLSPGDLVVTSGNFVVAAESRLRSATGFWSEGETLAPEAAPHDDVAAPHDDVAARPREAATRPKRPPEAAAPPKGAARPPDAGTPSKGMACGASMGMPDAGGAP